MKKILLLLSTLTTLIMGCSLYQKPEVPSVSVPHTYKYALQSSTPGLHYHWWENFDDRNLNQLVDLAIKNNYNYLIAIKNIEIAQTYVTKNAAYLYPQVSANYNASRNKNSFNSFNNYNNNTNLSGTSPPTGSNTTPTGNTSAFTSQQLFGSASYEVDAWNQVRNTVNQAKVDVIVAQAAGNVIKLTLMSDVVNLYFQINALNLNINNLHLQSSAARKIVALDLAQYHGGLIDISVVDDAKNQAETIKANLTSLIKQREILINTLAYLLGEYPEKFNYSMSNILGHQHFDQLIPSNLPSTVLENRPDVQEAYFQVLSYGYIEKQNLANFFPAFDLTGNFGYTSAVLFDFISGGRLFWNYGAGISQYLLDFGLRKSIYQASKLQYQSAVLNYKNVVINSFKEVDNALTSYQHDAVVLHTDENIYGFTLEKTRSANAQYQGGLTDYANYLTIQLSLLQSRYNLTNQRLSVAMDIVQAYQVMGLGL